MTRDTDRRAVYAAEDLVFGETLFSEPVGPAGILELAAVLATDAWWLRNGVPFEVVPTRRESLHSSAHLRQGSPRSVSGRVAQVRLSMHQEDAATLAHEVAHLLAAVHGEDTSHGPTFRAADVDVVAVLCGTIAAGRLARAFADAGLEIAARAWPEPDLLTDRGIYGRWRLTRQTAGVTARGG